mmetsp:Transcript_130781/g.419432  ORF Transcript_130781/g.419432 Transcript_130781/m.419432 type:complete len:95 (-) Transcript_130781:66-350(-)
MARVSANVRSPRRRHLGGPLLRRRRGAEGHGSEVCGCGVKVIAHLMTECQTYKKYDTQVGKCDCSSTACDEVSLSSGYSAPFNWQAASFEVSPC